MKKIISIVFSLVLLSTILLNFKEANATTPNVSIGSANVSVGDDISIPITVSNAVDVKTISLTIIYNGNLLTYTGYTQNYATPLETGTISVTTGTGGSGLKIMPVWTSDSPLNGDLVPITLNFTVNSPRTVSVPSTIQFGGGDSRSILNSSGVEVKSTFTFTNGSITSTLDSITITNPANKLSYYVGDNLDITGLVITGTYLDSSTQAQKITTDNITGFDSSAVSIGQVLTVTVEGKTATYNVDINEAPLVLSNIAITNPANKLSYYVGDTLDITGLEVTGIYSDSSTSVLTITSDNITGFDSSIAIEEQILVITVEDQTVMYAIEILAKPIIEIESLSVLPGEEISIPINLIDVIDVQSFSFNLPYNSNLLTYTGYTANYPTTGITTISSPVVSGQGLRITVTWTADSSLTGNLVPVTLNFVVSSPINESLPYTLAFGGLSGNSIKDSSNIEIKNNFTFTNGIISATPTLSSIAITNPANKLSYYVGDTLNIAGLEVTGTYSDSSTSIQTITIDNITGFDSSTTKTGQVLTVTVGDKTVTYTVDIKRRPSSGSGSSGSSGATVIAPVINTPPTIILPPVSSVSDCLSGYLFSPSTGKACPANNQPKNPNLNTSDGKATLSINTPSVETKVPSLKTTLRQGMQGDNVRSLQTYLNSKGYNSGTPDGKFGPKTRQAVIEFQITNGLVGDGIVGPMTRAYLK